MTRLPIVRDDTLLTDPPMRVGTAGWFDWLDQATSFAYQSTGGRYTARHEERSGRRFWYAYRQQNGVQRKTYLGRSAELTPQRLDEAARTLSQMAEIGSGKDTAGAWLSPLIATKIAAPQVSQSLVTRPEAMARCLDGLAHPCTIVAAPAGFGKTTLLTMVSNQARERGWRVAWVTLEESEQDSTHFWQYTLAALENAQPGVSATARHMLEMPRPAPAERMLTVLINELATAKTPILLVLDDYHRAATPANDQGLIFLIEHAPATLHLLLAARAAPAFPLARLHAQGRIAELQIADLRFSHDDAARFMRETMRVNLSIEQIAQLEERTEGWVAGLQLAALSLRGREDVPALASDISATPHYIAEYLIDEVVERQPEDIQTFLLLTSSLERLTGPLCDAVTGRSDSAAILVRLTQAQLFVTPLDAAQTWYRYHHLFAEVLRERLERRMPGMVKPCHQRAAHWLWQHGMADDAISPLLAAELYEEAAACIEQESDRLILHGEMAGLARWFHALPHDAALAHPHLCLLATIALILQGGEPEAVGWLDEVEQRYQGDHALPTELCGEPIAVRSFLKMWSGDISGGAALAQEAMRLLPPGDQLLRTLMLWMTHVIGIFGEGDISEAVRVMSELAEDSRRKGNMLVAFIALATQASAQLYLCRLRDAEQVCNEALRLLPGGEIEVPMAAMAYCIQGEIRREWNDLDAAETLLRHAIAISENMGSPEYINDGLLYLSQVQFARGRYDEALATLERIRSMVQMRQLAPWDLTQMEIVRARVLIACGNLDEANRWVEHRLRSRQQHEPGATEPLAFINDLEDLSMARIALARHDAASARAILEPLRAQSEHTGQRRNLMETHMLLARTYQMTGETEAALDELQAALTLAAPDGFVRVFLDEGDSMADLLAGYVASPQAASSATSREREHARTLLAAFGRAIVPTPAAPPDILSPREVDVLRLLAAGRSNEAIADDLVLALSTVKWHVAHIYRKLGVSSRVQAVARARELRLIA